jgi:photosystem II stability/assembly factor-like uncharacterized protein
MIKSIIIFAVIICLILSIGCRREKDADSRVTDQEIMIRPCPIEDIAFLGKDIAWIVTSRNNLLSTRDGGRTWDEVSSAAIDGFKQISFINSSNGWAINGYSQIWRTYDGGQTWLRIAELKERSYFFNDLQEEICFVDELHGWIIDPFSIWRTEDGGVNWQQSNLSRGNSSIGQVFQYNFSSSQLGCLYGSEGIFYSTNDGGKTWHWAKMGTDDSYIISLFFLDENNGWIVREGRELGSGKQTSTVYSTQDGGDTWSANRLPNSNMVLESICFVSKEAGWAAGAEKKESDRRNETIAVLLHTKDGGETWETLQINENESSYEKVFFADAEHGWALANGNVYRTEDEGRTWRVVLRESVDTYRNSRRKQNE